jgi:SAM-dependent methyltransferase
MAHWGPPASAARAASGAMRGSRSAGHALRRARMVVGVAEALLGRPVRSVLEVGCGDGTWRAALRRVRPGARYTGVDSSAYVVARFGRSRGIRFGTFGTLANEDLGGPYDLVLCRGVLNRVGAADLARGLQAISGLLGGVAYFEIAPGGTTTGRNDPAAYLRPVSFYRRAFRRAGLTPVGMQCWIGETLRGAAGVLDRV